MPIYEYTCQSCGYEKEVFQGIAEAPLTLCDQCGQSTLIKLVSAAGFRLKGSGWYETDFKDGDKKKNLCTTEESPKNSVPKNEKPTGSKTEAQQEILKPKVNNE